MGRKMTSMSEKSDEQDKIACAALRLAATSNIQLYLQADKKAHILIQANALMISVLLGGAVEFSIFHKLVFIPVSSQLLFSTVVILLCLRSTQPIKLLQRDAGDGSDNLLKFSDYDHMENEEYVTDMKEMLDDPDRTYASLIKEIYFQAQLIAGKYRYLDAAIIVFVIGLGISVLTAIGIAFY